MIAEKINKNQIEKLLLISFQSDKELVEKFHIESGNGIKKCMAKTQSDLLNCQNLNFYKLTENEKFCGWFGIEKFYGKNFLTGFFIMPQNRTKEYVTKFWNIIFSKTSGNFICGIYKKNERARKFLEKKLKFSEERIDNYNNKLLIFCN